MLDHNEMPIGKKKAMSGMGIQGRQIMLVYQWNHMPRDCPEKLERKIRDMPDM